MVLQNFVVHTGNYNLNSNQEKEIQKMVECLSQKIPCDSFIRIELDHSKDIFNGKIKIVAKHKHFFSNDSQKTISQLMEGLNKKMVNQVSKWKQNRTREDITGIIDLKDYQFKSERKQAS